MREDEVAQKGIRLACFHRHCHYVDDFRRIHAEEGGTEYFSRFFVDDGFQQAVGLFPAYGRVERKRLADGRRRHRCPVSSRRLRPVRYGIAAGR